MLVPGEAQPVIGSMATWVGESLHYLSPTFLGDSQEDDILGLSQVTHKFIQLWNFLDLLAPTNSPRS